MTTGAGKRTYAARMPPAKRRQQLLDAALMVIDEHGYEGVSMEAIARAAGVTKPVVYDLFANRNELLMALLRREEERALTQIAAAMPVEPSEDPEELLVAGFRAFIDSVAANPMSWRLILLPAAGTPAVVSEHVESGRGEVRARIERLLAWAVEARGGPVDTDFELAAQAFVATSEQLARLLLTDPKRYPSERAEAFIRGLRGSA